MCAPESEVSEEYPRLVREGPAAYPPSELRMTVDGHGAHTAARGCGQGTQCQSRGMNPPDPLQSMGLWQHAHLKVR